LSNIQEFLGSRVSNTHTYIYRNTYRHKNNTSEIF